MIPSSDSLASRLDLLVLLCGVARARAPRMLVPTISYRPIAYAHREGIIHRDIKPANLKRTLDGTIKVLDLGLARLRQPESMVGDTTDPGQALTGSLIVGTPDFMAPEQITNGHNVDQRSDIYALGCTLYTLLVGRPPAPPGTVLGKNAMASAGAATESARHSPRHPRGSRSLVPTHDESLAGRPTRYDERGPYGVQADPGGPC